MKFSKTDGTGLTRGGLLAGTAITLLAAIALPARAEESTVPAGASLDTLFTSKSWLNREPSRADRQNITPNLRALAARKRNDLAIIGIHTPETPIEHEHIEYWPTQMLFDRRGKLRKVIIGDSQDATVDAAVNALLRESA